MTDVAQLGRRQPAVGRYPSTCGDCKAALNRIAWILLNKGGQIQDITVGDYVELHTALREHQCGSATARPLYYTLLRETGALPPDSPPRLKAVRMAGQLSPAQLVDKYQMLRTAANTGGDTPHLHRPISTLAVGPLPGTG